MKIYTTLLITLILFAINSLIAKYVLLQGHAQPISFSAMRLLSGAFILLPVIWVHFKKNNKLLIKKRNVLSALSLFFYAIFFSYAYTSLDTGIGALILFGSVQVSMFGIAKIQGSKFKKRDYIGLAIAFLGLVYLINPNTGVQLNLKDATLMAIAGLSWGGYSLIGSRSKSPITDCALSFLILLPPSLIILFCTYQGLTIIGIKLSILSGAFTSGIAYCLWYLVSSKVSISTSSIFQISVPIFATIMGIIFLNESITMSFLFSSLIILIGIFIKCYPENISQ